MKKSFIVNAWNNGQQYKSGAGYGLKVSVADRDHYFRREWSEAVIELEGHGQLVIANVAKPSFWDGSCRELISAEIGRWLQANNLDHWPEGKLHKFRMTHLGGNRFRVAIRPVL